MSIDLTTLSVPALEQLIHAAVARLEVVKRQHLAQRRRPLEAQAREAGFDVYALFGGGDAAKSSKRISASTYRNPKNPEQTWAGIGKRPDWVRAAINAGESLESLKIA